MMKLLLSIALAFCFIKVSYSSCKNVYCPSSIFSTSSNSSSSFSCDMCHKCLDSKSRFCYTSNHKECQCATKIDQKCSYQSDQKLANFTYCHILDDFSVPAPIIKSDEHTISAIVSRFFQQSPYDIIKPSFLYLLATFSIDHSKCKSIGHIEAFQRSNNKCLLRVRLHMPKIDYDGHDNYYYDDKSDLESQFSRDIFGAAHNVTFWTEITLNKEEKLPKGSVSFATVQKSSEVFFDV